MFKIEGQVTEIEGTIKETLESVDKLQADLNGALASNQCLKHRAKSTEDQVVLLQRQVLELQA